VNCLGLLRLVCLVAVTRSGDRPRQRWGCYRATTSGIRDRGSGIGNQGSGGLGWRVNCLGLLRLVCLVAVTRSGDRPRQRWGCYRATTSGIRGQGSGIRGLRVAGEWLGLVAPSLFGCGYAIWGSPPATMGLLPGYCGRDRRSGIRGRPADAVDRSLLQQGLGYRDLRRLLGYRLSSYWAAGTKYTAPMALNKASDLNRDSSPSHCTFCCAASPTPNCLSVVSSASLASISRFS
jgi:hypothetical protein